MPYGNSTGVWTPDTSNSNLGTPALRRTIDTDGDHIDTERRDEQRRVATAALDRNLTI